MIRVERSPEPDDLQIEALDVERAWTAQYFLSTPSSRLQQTFEFSLLFLNRVILPALRNQFRNKCAFCESHLSASRGEVDHYRPKSQALGASGDESPDHYWWLAYEWSNLYLVCEECNRLKGNRFPVGAQRVVPETYEFDELDREEPLLLDPCRDEVEQHLGYTPAGMMLGLTDRGRATIDILGLNRIALVEQRSQALQAGLKSLPRQMGEEDAAWLVADDQEYAGILRYFMSRLLAEDSSGAIQKPPTKKSLVVDETAVQDQTSHMETVDVYSITDESAPGKASYYAKTRYIERIQIRNFKIIDALDLIISPNSGAGAPWLMLLGENGAGKSTLLQALALTLLTERDREQLIRDEHLDARNYLRHGASDGHIRIQLTGDHKPLEIRFSMKSASFESLSDSKVLSLAYGATRLPPRAEHPANPATPFSKAGNLFNPFRPLIDSGRWLSSLPETQFQQVASGLRKVILLDEDEMLEVKRGVAEPGVVIRVQGHETSIRELSDGYQSVFGLVADIMSVMLHRWGSLESAEGIVLIDELGAHLHPQWKLRIVELLRAQLPRVQIVATTHDPLCLWGLGKGEIAVLSAGYDGDFEIATSGLPDASAMSVQDLLTSTFFGLRSTVSPDVSDRIDRYYRLLTVADPNPEQEVEMANTRKLLASSGFLGNSSREKLLYQSLDRVIADRQAEIAATPEEVKDAAAALSAELWNELEASP